MPHADSAPSEPRSVQSLEALERSYIIATLRKTHGITEGPRGAALLDMKPSALRHRLKELGISRETA